MKLADRLGDKHKIETQRGQDKKEDRGVKRNYLVDQDIGRRQKDDRDRDRDRDRRQDIREDIGEKRNALIDQDRKIRQRDR